MASRIGELSRSNGCHGPTYNLTSTSSRRELGSQGGRGSGQTAESGELGADSGWHVVDARNGRHGRSWQKLFKQLTKLLDDIYLTCELDCSLAHVATMTEYLEASAGDFAELHSQLESVVSPSGQKVAWEVRACRRTSNRSPRIVGTSYGNGGGSNAREHGHFTANAAMAAASSTAPAIASGDGVPALAPESWQAAVAAAAGNTRQPTAFTRTSALLRVRRAVSCSSAPDGSGGRMLTAAALVGCASSEGGGLGEIAGGTAAVWLPGPGSGPVQESDNTVPPQFRAADADGGNPWRGKVNWNELFARQHQSQHQKQQAHPGTPQATQLGTGTVAAPAPAAGGDGTGDGGGFRLGTALPPPRLKTSAASGGGGAGGSFVGSESCFSPSGGPPSPPDSLYHKMLSSPSRKLSPSEVRRASEERQARAEKARQAMVEEKLARLAQANQSRQTVKSMLEERAGAIAAKVDSKIARSAELRQAHLAERVQKAVEETKKVAEVAFINQMLEQDKKLALQEKLEEGESRRRQALEALQQRGKGAAAAVGEAQERRKMLEAERREQLFDRQRRKMAAQAKLEEERRAAAAAREAASRAQRAAAAQAAEARQRLRDVLSVRIEERLREAAARRAQHLELIKERAALGKDLYERRTMDGNATSPRSPQSRYTRPPSPEVASASAGGHQLLPPPPLVRPATPPGSGASARPWHSGASATAGAGGAATASIGSGAQLPCSPSGLHSSTSHATLTADGSSCPSPLRSSDRSITLSADPRRRLKGMRRRVCKSLARLEAARPDYTEPIHLQTLLEGADGRELVLGWAQLVEAALRDTATAAAADSAATTAGKAGRRKGAREPATAPAAAVSAAATGLTASGGNDSSTITRGSSGGGKGSSAGPTGSSGGAVTSGGTTIGLEAAVAAASVKHLLQRVHTDLGGRSKGIALHAARPSGLLTALAELLTAPTAAAASHPPQTSVQLMELLALLVTSTPYNAAWLLARSGASSLTGLVRCGMRALDRYNGLAADEVWEEPPEARYLAALLQTLACLCRTPFADQPSLPAQQEELVAYVVACGLIHRSTELFSLFDQPAANDTAPIPGYVLQCLALLEAITGGPRRRSPAAGLTIQKRWLPQAANGAAIALAFQETSMAGLPSLLTAVLLRAAPSCTPAEARPERLPPNFVEAAACVMRVLNNIARLDLVAAQSSLGASDLRVVFFHLVGFLLSYCTNQWPMGRGVEPAIRAALNAAASGSGGVSVLGGVAMPGTASPVAGPAVRLGGSGGGARGSPAGGPSVSPPLSPPAAPPANTGLVQLLNEVLLLIGFYGVLQPANQDVLLWGKSPTILQRLAEVPFPYFVEQQLYQVLMPTLLSVCYGSERACATLAQHMDLHLLQSYVQTMIRQLHLISPPSANEAEQQGVAAEQDREQASAGATHGAAVIEIETQDPSSSLHDTDASAVEMTGPAPLSPRRQLLQDLPTTAPGMSGGGVGVSSRGNPAHSLADGAHSPGSNSNSHSGEAGGAAVLTAECDMFELPPPTADRYSLLQRFPPELLPQVLAFLERQMPGAVDRANLVESSLAAAVAAAAAVGRLTAAPPQLSSSPLAVLATEGRNKKAASKKAAAAAAAAPAVPATAIQDSKDAQLPLHPHPPAEAAASVTIVESTITSSGGPVWCALERDFEGKVVAAPSDAGGYPAGTRGPRGAIPPDDANVLTPNGKTGSVVIDVVEDAASGITTDSQPPSNGAGAGGTASSGRGGSSGGSLGYGHQFRRFLDVADVPVPFVMGAVRRQRMFEAAAAAVAEVSGGGGGSGSLDASNCARSYVSELSFGGYLTPSLHGDSRDGEPRSPGEDERMALDEFDLEQYEQQRLDEQQQLDEQDVLLLDEPCVDGGGAGSRSKASLLAAMTGRKPTASSDGGKSGDERRSSSPPDLGAGLLLAAKKAKGHVDRHVLECEPPPGERPGSKCVVPESTVVVMDAWWRRIGYEFGGAGNGSNSESVPDEADREGVASMHDSPPLSPSAM
ncbi:hypothetical protein VaNZ11_012325 [Volvox africanus]|uniref:S phase cyclin A-associated protein in the endoplasmic reticulum N-terminal domain-containing protein n=1 Tax=Volvox africanus TaxID=51714 RepID=A0ABQ5SEX4_9CHLO|nr:hypothetical protein VaNZ11_012325 [Volvox africanus]